MSGSAESTAQAPSNFVIVVVEDNPADILLVREALHANSVDSHLETYGTGESALAGLSRWLETDDPQLPNLVLLDWNLPVINGAEVLRTIRRWPLFNSTPVAVLTSSGSPRDRSQALHLGATRFIQKPMNLDDFVLHVGKQIRELLRGGGAQAASPQS